MDFAFARILGCSQAIPHRLSFCAPEHGRQLCAVEAVIGLSFL
jgi:hypothetical protein